MSQDDIRAQHQLTEAQALDAMREFLLLHEGHADTPSDVARLLYREPDGVPTDPAVWIDWLICVRKAKGLASDERSALDDAVASGGWIGREASARLAKHTDASRDIHRR